LMLTASLDASPAPSTSFSRSLPARPTSVNEPCLRASLPGGLLSSVTVKSRWFRLLASFRLCACTERFDYRSECTSRVSLVECTATSDYAFDVQRAVTPRVDALPAEEWPNLHSNVHPASSLTRAAQGPCGAVRFIHPGWSPTTISKLSPTK
jgi:hypothetical protein